MLPLCIHVAFLHFIMIYNYYNYPDKVEDFVLEYFTVLSKFCRKIHQAKSYSEFEPIYLCTAIMSFTKVYNDKIKHQIIIDDNDAINYILDYLTETNSVFGKFSRNVSTLYDIQQDIGTYLRLHRPSPNQYQEIYSHDCYSLHGLVWWHVHADYTPYDVLMQKILYMELVIKEIKTKRKSLKFKLWNIVITLLRKLSLR